MDPFPRGHRAARPQYPAKRKTYFVYYTIINGESKGGGPFFGGRRGGEGKALCFPRGILAFQLPPKVLFPPML